MPALPKHLRPRWRYLGVSLESWPDAEIDRSAFQRDLWSAAQDLVGDAGSARADLSVLGFRFEAPVGETVVRARHGHVEAARAALACLDEVDGDPLGVHVRGVSGTVRACEAKFCPWLADRGDASDDGDSTAGNPEEEKYIRRGREPTEERDVAFGGAERSALIRGRRADVRAEGAFTGATDFDLE